MFSGLWFDPPLTSGYDYVGTGGTLFTGITLPNGLGSAFQVFGGPGYGTNYGTFGANTMVNFGGPTEQFRITGIDPAVDAALANAFPLQIFFSSETGSFTQTPLGGGNSSVPEPTTWRLVGLGLVAALSKRSRIRRSGRTSTSTTPL